MGNSVYTRYILSGWVHDLIYVGKAKPAHVYRALYVTS
jgi:hypothetical protein